MYIGDGRILSTTYEYCAGLDLGQKNDYTAVALIEKQTRVLNARCPRTYEYERRVTSRVVHLERMPLGTAYPKIVTDVRNLLVKAPPGPRLSLVVDSTGVGRPVVDLIRDRGVPGWLVPVTITGGTRVIEDGAELHVPKRVLITWLQVAFETEELLIESRMPGVEELMSELTAMRVRAGAQFDSWREGAHDDMVFAVALAWWEMKRRS